jgi:flagellar basal-body rod protein FlgF
MQPSLYVSLSGQIALERRLETIANNVANVATAGYRAEEVKFGTILSRVPPDPANFANTKGTYISRRAGELVQTQNPFDIAVQGDAWLSIDAGGQQVYTRDGRMKMTGTGDLQTLNGYSVLDVGGAPITLDPRGSTPIISADGTITQDKRQIGAIGLFQIPDQAKLTRFENSGVIPAQPAEPALDFSRVGVVQGFVERSNVNPVMEMTRLIMVQRSFEALTTSITSTENTFVEGIRTLGSPS